MNNSSISRRLAASIIVSLFVIGFSRLWNGREVQTSLSAQESALQKAEKSFAIVELFTSEGCSSCPPADANLKRLSEFAAAKHINVIPLSFHVDYWNYLGWEDPFSDKAFSDRQIEYAKALDQSQRIYTPQMVVNGRYTFNGGDRKNSDKAVQLALQQPVRHHVNLKRSSHSPSSQTDSKLSDAKVLDQEAAIEVSVSLSNDAAKQNESFDSAYEVSIVTVTDNETVQVKRGENSGRALSHVWVVRSLQTVPLTNDTSSFNVSLHTAAGKHTRVVVFVQSKMSREMTGASVLVL